VDSDWNFDLKIVDKGLDLEDFRTVDSVGPKTWFTLTRTSLWLDYTSLMITHVSYRSVLLLLLTQQVLHAQPMRRQLFKSINQSVKN